MGVDDRIPWTAFLFTIILSSPVNAAISNPIVILGLNLGSFPQTAARLNFSNVNCKHVVGSTPPGGFKEIPIAAMRRNEKKQRNRD